jgi:membrane associated rhomboid family serine protease
MATRSVTRRADAALGRVRQDAGLLASGLGALWIVHVANVLTGGALVAFGIVPRTLTGLLGIVAAPFLHGSVAHLLSNSLPLLVLGALLLTRGRRDFAVVTAASVVGSGLGAWLFGGPGTVHIGASGLLFGWLGFLMARGVFERSLASVAMSVAVTFWMGGMVWGVLPLAAGVSWQAHLFGFLTGLYTAFRWRLRK